ncbi:MAG: hypothetical protein E3J35_00210 [Methanomassiliicoccales archaeon]|nr:MAG: hypothetical protein E3J35_00210 [Methanomassiliicoccales archaeon]
MTEIFKAKLRQIGNSLGVIIPSEIIEERGFAKGDEVPLALPPSSFEKRNEKLRKMIGLYKGTKPFKRDKEDRY